jgi:hypothetical protein
VASLRAGVAAQNSFTANAAPTLAFAGAVTAGDNLYIAIRNGSDETTTITGVSDDVNGAWTLVSGPSDHASTTLRGWKYCFPNSGAGTPTVTVSFSAAINGHLAVGALVGAQTSATPDATGATRVTSTSADTTHTSNAVNNNAAGGIIGAIFTSATVTLTAGAGTDTVINTGSGRAFLVFTASPTVTSYTQAVTSSVGTHSMQMISSWADAGGATAAQTSSLTMLGVGM